MELKDVSTRQLIVEAGKKEFIEKGFQGASLRIIAQNAFVTTGALYGYFKSKEDLFANIVKSCYDVVKNRFLSSNDNLFALPVNDDSVNSFDWLIDYIYDNYETFKILICCSQGTSFENFKNDISEIAVKSLLKYAENIDEYFCHIIVSGAFEGVFELVEHDIPYENAKQLIARLVVFYHAGWNELVK